MKGACAARTGVCCLQSDAFDFIALGIGIAATLRPSAALLFPCHRLPSLRQFYVYFAAISAGVYWSIMYIGVLELLNRQSWYTGGNGSEEQVSSVHAVLGALLDIVPDCAT